MNDRPPSRLELLRFTERVAVQHLEQIRKWIADEERRRAERAEGERRRPPDPDWLIERGLQGHKSTYVHVGGCHMRGKRSVAVSRDMIREALREGVDACPHCRPDTALGLLDG